MDQLLSDTLKLSRIGRVANPPEEMCLLAKLFRKHWREQNSAKLKSSGVEVSVAGDFPAVHVDRMRIVEVLVNLIGNSINYMGEQPHKNLVFSISLNDSSVNMYKKIITK